MTRSSGTSSSRARSPTPPTADGKQVIARGRVTAYIARGEYQIVVTSMREAGVGDLMRRLLELKEKLKREGLFDEDRKPARKRQRRRRGPGWAIAVGRGPVSAAMSRTAGW